LTSAPGRDAVYRHIEANAEAHLAAIRALIRQPSVSLEKQSLGSCAALMRDALAAAGCADAAVVEVGDAYPGVYARVDSGRKATLLVYGHYDVRPVGVETWSHEPFAADVAPFGGFPNAVIGRGAAAKGPLQAFINAVGSMLAVDGSLPVNLVFLLEGAEILGSPNYDKLVAARQAEVSRATGLYGPRASQDARGTVAINLGYKGLIYLELAASGAAWGRGPVAGAVHSATQAVVDSPAWRLVQALATITDATGTKVAVPELLEALAPGKPIAAWEEPLVDALATRFESGDPNGLIPGLTPQTPAKLFRDDLKGRALLERYMYGPSVNISGLRSGYTGPGTKSFLLPDIATATLDIRLVTETPAREILAILRRHLDAHGFADVAIDARCAYDWNQTSVDADLVRAGLGLLESRGLPTAIWPMQAYGGPWAHFARTFGIPSVQGLAPGHGARIQTSDEFFVIEGKDSIVGLTGLERYFVDFLDAYAAVAGKPV
jgi:acetylornithine deacetylase/succinyl-diaminopimelate desuccinylase-like protein